MSETGLCEFRGGLRHGLLNATWPSATLRADSEVLTIRTDGFMDDIRLGRLEVTSIRNVRGLWSRGLRFDTIDGRLRTVIYWTPPRRHDAVRQALRQRGWPVA